MYLRLQIWGLVEWILTCDGAACMQFCIVEHLSKKIVSRTQYDTIVTYLLFENGSFHWIGFPSRCKLKLTDHINDIKSHFSRDI